MRLRYSERSGQAQGTKAFHHDSTVPPPSCKLWPAFGPLQSKHFAASSLMSLLPSIKRQFTLLWPAEEGIWSSYSWKLPGRGWGRTALMPTCLILPKMAGLFLHTRGFPVQPLLVRDTGVSAHTHICFTWQGRCSMWLLCTHRQKQSKTQPIHKLQRLWAHPYILLFFSKL